MQIHTYMYSSKSRDKHDHVCSSSRWAIINRLMPRLCQKQYWCKTTTGSVWRINSDRRGTIVQARTHTAIQKQSHLFRSYGRTHCAVSKPGQIHLLLNCLYPVALFRSLPGRRQSMRHRHTDKQGCVSSTSSYEKQEHFYLIATDYCVYLLSVAALLVTSCQQISSNKWRFFFFFEEKPSSL